MAKILVVDDSSFMRNYIRISLENAGHLVIGEACNGNEALEKYLNLRPNLVIMDINMGETHGIDGLRKIKTIDPKAKVLMCSAMGQEVIITECLDEGALDFIIKPFNTTKIVNVVSKVLQS